MQRTLYLCCLIALASVATAQEAWTPLFNGRDLTGWKQLNGKAKYTIEDGAIVGTSIMNTPNSFLATEATYGDFILELEVKLDSPLNSGIQFRSLSKPDYQEGRVHGYQFELDPSLRAWTGGIYDEARRGWLYPLELNPPARQAFHNGRWNHVRIEAIGHSIRTWVNGIPCADLVDDLTPRGFIALQVHAIDDKALAGKQVRWRNIRIQTENLRQSPWTDFTVVNLIPNYLSPQERAQGWELLFDGQHTTGWRGAHKTSFPASGWRVENGELIVEPSGGGESTNGGDIVTEAEFTAFELQLEFKIAPGANSGIKYFITENYASSGSAIGLEYQILDDERHPDAKLGAAGNRTVGSLYDLIPAHKDKVVRQPGEWNHARIVVQGTYAPGWPNHRDGSYTLDGAFVQHWLNGRLVLAYTRGDQAFDALVARSKYADWEGFGHWTRGRILLQDHGDEVRFRSIKIRRL
ncbi:MAG: DUF1080 domain-containing protein [Bacteroidia bacterium]